jgi:signal transduction histidine kinase/DNA-binding NarL/FixJ family response regulator/predicted hydrocarbon binding protein
MSQSPEIIALQQRIAALENENAMLRRDFRLLQKGNSVSVPAEMKPLFDIAEQTVSDYFRNLKMDPTKGTIEINDQRYVLVRASGLSKDFLETVQSLYADRGASEAMAIGKNFLFDIAHVIGMNDAKNFHTKMKLTDPISKLSAGPVHFAYSGWAYVDILPESNPSPDENFYLIYHHPFSFEADSWIRDGKKADTPVCIMNSGYSSGWCEASFGIPLTAVEVSCIAKGDERCTFIMAPPHKIQEHINRYHQNSSTNFKKEESYAVPTFFERKKVEEEMHRSKTLAEESAKSKSDFIANMSHELRTPLGAILGFTGLLRKTDLDVIQKDYVDAISSSGNSLLSIINDILDLSKLDAGRFIIETVPFNIPELMHSVQVMFAARAKKKGLQFSCSVDTALNFSVSGDPMRLTQILVNLIGNALKFTEKGGVYVNCLVEEEDEQYARVLFSVRDTGIGIPEEKTETVFERFTQADSNITRKYGGTGLGLAITKQLVELHGGTIQLKSNSSSGVEFQFSLPYARAIADQKPTPINKELIEHLQYDTVKKVLIVEDNLMNQKLATIILQSNGFEITLADNGSKAVDILKEKTFDVILMDIQMPVMDGYRATQIIRDELHICTPIIAMTAHALAGEKEKCIQLGMNDYLSKPFKENDLLLKIAQWAPNGDSHADNNNGTEKISAGKSIIDLSFLLTQARSNKTFILEMIQIFKQQTPKDMATLEEAIGREDFLLIYKTTHTVRNTIGFFGLTPVVGNELLAMEKISRTNTGIDIIRTHFTKVKAVFEKAVEELENLDVSSLSLT